jgi:Fe-S cluster biosynthesis and repair protein YggX/rhodanese-related sulfurtransferase
VVVGINNAIRFALDATRLWTESSSSVGDFMNLKRITADEAKRLMDTEGYKLLDVRSMPEYNAEHPEGAYNVPYLHRAPHGMIPNQDFARVVQSAFPDKSEKIITTCQMGGRSVRAAAELMNLGYTNVLDLRGGFGSERDDGGNVVVKGWKDSGLPTEAGETTGRAYKDVNNQANAPAHASTAPAPEAAAATAGACATPAAAPTGHVSRFANPNKVVDCVKYGKQLPGLKRRPMPGALGERIFNQVSADAWELWAEHAKMLINEYRLNPSDARAQELLQQQCEAFFFGEGARLPEGFVPQAAGK